MDRSGDLDSGTARGVLSNGIKRRVVDRSFKMENTGKTVTWVVMVIPLGIKRTKAAGNSREQRSGYGASAHWVI